MSIEPADPEFEIVTNLRTLSQDEILSIGVLVRRMAESRRLADLPRNVIPITRQHPKQHTR